MRLSSTLAPSWYWTITVVIFIVGCCRYIPTGSSFTPWSTTGVMSFTGRTLFDSPHATTSGRIKKKLSRGHDGGGGAAAGSGSGSGVVVYMSLPTPLDTLTSGLASIVRIPNGVSVVVSAAVASPTIRIRKLYDIENDPNCRLVRERITELDLVVESVIPSCRNSRVQVPSVPQMVVVVEVEEGKEVVLQGVDEILSFLNATTFSINDDDSTTRSVMGDDNNDYSSLSSSLLTAWNSIPAAWTSQMASWFRAGRGSSVTNAALSSPPRPTRKLILYNYEGNQFCRLVREVLTELDLEYEMRPCGKGSPRRQELSLLNQATDSSSQCPQFIDFNFQPSTSTTATIAPMRESKDIIDYLYRTYAQWTPPNEVLQRLSGIVTPLLKPVYSRLAPLQAGDGYDALAKQRDIDADIQLAPIVVYTYQWSPFCSEAMTVLKRLKYVVDEDDKSDGGSTTTIKEISLGYQWIPGLIQDAGKRAALGERTGQTSLPHIFVGGQSIGGLFSGTPGLIPSLENGSFPRLVQAAKKAAQTTTTPSRP
jgi:glutaredoxin